MLSKNSTFSDRIRRGRVFEDVVRRHWRDTNKFGELHFERATRLHNKRGRVDIFIDDDNADFATVIELKMSDWDAMKAHRIRPNAMRHVRQIWRYIDGELSDDRDICPAVIYPYTPQTPGRKEQIEDILYGQWGIVVLWFDTEQNIEDDSNDKRAL